MSGILLTSLVSLILYVVCLLVLISEGRSGRKKTLTSGLSTFVLLFIIAFALNYLILLPMTITNMVIANIVMAIIGIAVLIGIASVEKRKLGSFSVVGGLVIILLIIALPTTFILGVKALGHTYDSIQKETVGEAQPVSKDHTPITVSPEFARNKIHKKMSVVPNTQFYDLGKLQVQKIKDDIVYVAPVEFTGFFKYYRGKETAGYFRISATDINASPEFVESKMKYTSSSYFSHNIDRVIYGNFPSYIQSGDAQIEVDDNGKPWYVQTIYKPIGLTNKPDMKTLRVAVIDPTTGKASSYPISQAPAFINGSMSSEMATTENNYFGKYKNGWLNSHFGKKDVKLPNSSGTENSVTPIFGDDGQMYYFTDMASPKKSVDSALGYTLINARTGELTYYNSEKNNGIMDSKGAKEIVNKEFPEKKWKGSMPILYNIDQTPTWIVNVLDPNGLLKKYAYIKADNADFVVFGDTAKETLEAYRLKLAQDPSNVHDTGKNNLKSVSGTVDRVLVTTQKSGEVVQFLLKNDKTIYTVNSGKAPLALFLQHGDHVKMKVNIRDNGTGLIDTIDIKDLND